MSSIIRLTRIADDIGSLIRLPIYIDGKKVGMIPLGGTMDFFLKPGQHNIQVRELVFWRSKLVNIDIVDNEILNMECGHYRIWRSLVAMIFLSPLLFLWLLYPKGVLWFRIMPKVI
jgi:hypothetical protein